MRIALVNKYWHLKGGSERAVFDTKEILESHGHVVSCFGMAHPDNVVQNEFFVPYIEYGEQKGLQKITGAFKSISNKKTKKAFGAFLDHYKPDVVHIHNIYHQLTFSILDEAIKRHIPIVATMHDYKMVSPNYRLFHHGKVDMSMLGGQYYRGIFNNHGESFFKSIILTLEAYYRKKKKYTEHISAFIAPSRYVEKIARQAGLSKEKVRYITYPMNLNVFIPHARESNYVLFFGRFSEEKGLDVLLRAAAKTPDIQYRLVGEGEELLHLEKMIQTLKLSNVEIFPFQTGDELVKTITEAKLTVMPSIWPEVLGLSALRSIAYRKIVIASNMGGLGEMVTPDMLVPANDPGALAEKITEWYHKPSRVRLAAIEPIKHRLTEVHDPEKYYADLITCYAEARANRT